MNSISPETINRLVFNLQKPARYVGGELNTITRERATVRMAICYPDLYEVGMSNHGIRIIYDLANRVENAACERVFAVAPDFEEKARKTGVPLYTLETRTPLKELDLLGFTVSHELLATNILQVLDLGGIPLGRKDRGAEHPLVMAGGEGISNPAPLMDFMDLFYLGDGEEGIADILGVMITAKEKGLGRAAVLEALGRVEGVMVADRYRYHYEGGRLARIDGPPVRKRVYRGGPLDPESPIVPNIRIAQDRAVAEVTRGCKNLCAFCQAGHYDLPCREYSMDQVARRVEAMIKNSGYNELTLASLSVSDYRHLTPLLKRILPALTEQGVSISYPSLRVDLETLPLIEAVSDLRKSSLTFAVESASEEIRARAWKRLRNEDLLEILEHVFAKGWRTIKLYFMLGLPGCDRVDEAAETAALLKTILGLGRGKKEINVTLSPFVPKPHTPFQWELMMDTAYFDETIRRIKRELPRSVNVKNHNVRASQLEAVMARGDTRLGQVILGAYRDGCRLDSWGEFFRHGLWEDNLDRMLPEWRRFISALEPGTVLPWDMVRTGKEKLLSMRRNRQADLAGKKVPRGESIGAVDLSGALDAFARKYEVRSRVRVKFSKIGFARFIPHIDFMEIIKRSLRMAGVPVSFTRGFNKRERIALGYPVPLGIESLCEFCDIDLYEEISPGPLPEELNARLPRGVRALSARQLEEKESLMALTRAVEYRVKAEDAGLMESLKSGLRAGNDFIFEGKKGNRHLKFDMAVIKNSTGEDFADIVLTAGEENALRADMAVLLLSGCGTEELYRFLITRTGQFMKDGETLSRIS
ncbi:MAG TPA: TIGR03960 family B12-binding radical SAM protein [Spirochaetes bacterium]|nr:TIGR03960 family B12-binding radical SAM protein [Spirochaetota bacterium]